MLSKNQLEILEKLFVQFTSEGKGINSKVFRSKLGSEGIDDVDYLVTQLNLIKKEQISNELLYFPSLVALSFVNNQKTNKIVTHLNHLFNFFSEEYTKNCNKQFCFKDIKKELHELPLTTFIVLWYAIEANICWGDLNLEGDKDSKIQVDETVKRYNSFNDILEEREEHLRKIIKNKGKTPRLTSFSSFSPKSRIKRIPTVGTVYSLSWPPGLPQSYSDILDEITIAYENNLYILVATGLRIVIDRVGEKKTQGNSFKDKLKGLVDGKFITEKQKVSLNGALEVGHAAAHRGHKARKEQIDLVVDITKHLLISVYSNECGNVFNDIPRKNKSEK